MLRGAPQLLGVGLRIRHRDQAARLAPDDRGERGEGVLLLGVLGDPVVELRLRQVLGIEAGAVRMRLRTDERLQLVEPVPGTLVDLEKRLGGFGLGAAPALHVLPELGIALPGLALEDRLHLARRRDEILEDGLLGGRQP